MATLDGMALPVVRMQVMTERLRLRPWRDEDRDPYAALVADPVVMEHFPAVMTRAESDAMIDRLMADFERDGWGLWAAERKDTGEFIGFIGLHQLAPTLPIAPGVEVGWRLAAKHWGQGFATEGAHAALAFGFNQLRLPEIVAFTDPANQRSQRVMGKLGMTRDPSRDFDHPRGGRAIVHRIERPTPRP